jgi:hypothetical protein
VGSGPLPYFFVLILTGPFGRPLGVIVPSILIEEVSGRRRGGF